ncbi:P68 family surface lipoprotein [Metamycoplasma spumans]|uniref:P68 family surface lipoprotein n=1 Tax=Metamycoplasma spumans TaxID=92406 RepID=UPI0034DDA36B
MKKANKILLGLAPLGATLAVLPLAASCGAKSPRFEQSLDKVIKIGTGFSSSGDQYKALKAMVDEYNKTIKSEGWKVELAPISGGYDTSTLTQKLEAKDDKQLWNLIVNYPASASIVSSYDMSLAISDADYESFGFAPAFKDVNKTVAGNVNNEKWVIPMSRSTEMISVAKPLYGKLLKELTEKAEIQKATENVRLIDEYISYYDTHKEEAKAIDDLWRKAESTITPELKAEIKTLVPKLDDSVFESFESLINLSIAMKKMYSESTEFYIYGIDSLPNVINTMVSAATGGNLEVGYITPDASKQEAGGWDYETFFRNPNSAQGQVFKNALDIILKGINSGALWIGGNGAYGSNQLQSYKLALSEGSTAGWSYTFVKSNGLTEVFVKNSNKLAKLENKTIELSQDEGVAFVVVDGKHKNNVYKSTTVVAKKGKFDYTLSASSDSINFTEKNGWYFVAGNYEVKDGKLVINYQNKDKKANVEIESGKFVELGNVDQGGKTKKYFLINPDQLDVITKTSSEILNEQDADWIPTPYNKSSSETHKAVFQQGPSFVGIHANEEEDAQTIKFIKWFFTHEFDSVSIPKGKDQFTKEQIKPIDMFNLYGGYVSPTSTFFATSVETLGLNKANKIAFEQFSKINTNNDSKVYVSAEDVASVKSDTIRKIITTTAVSSYEGVAAGHKVTFEEFLKKISDQFKAF